MPFYPIDGSPQHYLRKNTDPNFSEAVRFASNYYLKFYASGTDDPIQAAISQNPISGDPDNGFFDKFRLDSRGVPINNSGGVVVPHVDQRYKMILYKTAADADSNNQGASEWTRDDLAPGLIDFEEATGLNDSANISYLADDTAIVTDVQTKLRETVSVKDFGAVGDGFTDDDAAIGTALLAGKTIIFPEGDYLTGGVTITQNYQRVIFQGDVSLVAKQANVRLFKQVASYSRHEGTFRCDSNGQTGTIGLYVGPLDETSTVTQVFQWANVLPGVIGDTDLQDCVVLQNGAAASECAGNIFPLVDANGARRGVHLKPPADSGATYTPKGNLFHLVRGSRSEITTNTLIHIESGNRNTFQHVEAVDVANGSTPSTTPTAIRFDNECPSTSIDNEHNTVISGYAEGCTRDIECASRDNNFVGFDFDFGKSQFNSFRHPRLCNRTNQIREIYCGRIINGTTSQFLPDGWSVSDQGNGKFRVTHNLSTSNYAVTIGHQSGEVIGTTNANFSVGAVIDFQSNYFTVQGAENKSSNGDRARGVSFSFIVAQFSF